MKSAPAFSALAILPVGLSHFPLPHFQSLPSQTSADMHIGLHTSTAPTFQSVDIANLKYYAKTMQLKYFILTK